MSPLLALVPLDAEPPQAEQQVLRPVIAFVRELVQPPLRVRMRCRQVRPPMRVKLRCKRRVHRSETWDLFDPRLRRPFKFAVCIDDPGPCPFVTCRHHLALDIREDGGLTVNFPGLLEDPAGTLERAAFTCSLKAAGAGEMMLEDIAPIFDVTSERISQISSEAERKYENGVMKLSSVVELIEDRWR